MARIEDIDRQIVRLRSDNRERLGHIRDLADDRPSAQAAVDEAIELEAAAIRAATSRVMLKLVKG